MIRALLIRIRNAAMKLNIKLLALQVKLEYDSAGFWDKWNGLI